MKAEWIPLSMKPASVTVVRPHAACAATLGGTGSHRHLKPGLMVIPFLSTYSPYYLFLGWGHGGKGIVCGTKVMACLRKRLNKGVGGGGPRRTGSNGLCPGSHLTARNAVGSAGGRLHPLACCGVLGLAGCQQLALAALASPALSLPRPPCTAPGQGKRREAECRAQCCAVAVVENCQSFSFRHCKLHELFPTGPAGQQS